MTVFDYRIVSIYNIHNCKTMKYLTEIALATAMSLWNTISWNTQEVSKNTSSISHTTQKILKKDWCSKLTGQEPWYSEDVAAYHATGRIGTTEELDVDPNYYIKVPLNIKGSQWPRSCHRDKVDPNSMWKWFYKEDQRSISYSLTPGMQVQEKCLKVRYSVERLINTK